MDDVRGDILGPPHGTTPVTVIANENKTSFLEIVNIQRDNVQFRVLHQENVSVKCIPP